MKLNRSLVTAALLTASIALPGAPARAAEIAKDTMVIVSEMGPNGLDTMVPTANDHSRMVVWQAYDRLVSHGEKKLADGTVSYDAKVMTPELAESWEATDDGKTYVFHLRKDATFHDGSPVTAKDVKWSFDRAIAAGGFPAVQMAAGSLVKPEQFTVVDDRRERGHQRRWPTRAQVRSHRRVGRGARGGARAGRARAGRRLGGQGRGRL